MTDKITPYERCLTEDACLIRALKVSRDHIRSLWDAAKADLVRQRERLQQAETRIAELEYQLADAKAQPVNDDIWSRELVVLGDDSFIIRVRHQDIARMARAVEAYNGESEAA